MSKVLLISYFTLLILANCEEKKEVKKNSETVVASDLLFDNAEEPIIELDTVSLPSRGLKEIPDTILHNPLPNFWEESRIKVYYKLDEQHNFTNNIEKETLWVADILERITDFGYFKNSEVSSKDMNWNPGNDLYYFITVPFDTAEERHHYSEEIEITINGIPVPSELIDLEITSNGKLYYYKLPNWFWRMELISKNVDISDLIYCFGKEYKKTGPPYVIEPEFLKKLKTEVYRVYLKEDEEGYPVERVNQVLLSKNIYLYAIASC